MKKAFAFVVVLIIATGAFAFYRGDLRLPGRSPVVDVPGSSEAAPGTNQPPPVATPSSGGTNPSGNGGAPGSSGTGQTGSGTPAQVKTVHSILGRSNQLTDKQWQAMLDWRKFASTFAGSHAGVFVNGWPKSKEVCLTFDDGPDSAVTPRVLDILEQHGIKASFFFIGDQLDDNKDVVKRAFADGDLVLSHTWDHRQLIKLTPDQIRDELKRTADKLNEIIGVRPAIVRPPFGDIDNQTAKVLHDDGDAAVLWSIDTLDWSQKDKDNIVKNVVDNVRPGDIILMHTTPEQAVDVDALPVIIEQLQKQGYHFATLSDMLGVPAYK